MAVDEHRKTELARQDHRLRLPVEQQNHRAVAAIVGLTALSLPNAVAPQKIKGGFQQVPVIGQHPGFDNANPVFGGYHRFTPPEEGN